MQKGNSRPVLFLTELIIAILIFALCMGICGGVFAHAFAAATASTTLNNAVFLAESAAEAFYACDNTASFAEKIGGKPDGSGNLVSVYYNKDWDIGSAGKDAVFTLIAEVSKEDGVEKAKLVVSRGGQPLFELNASKNNLLRRAARDEK
jgi:hypothetical protein